MHQRRLSSRGVILSSALLFVAGCGSDTIDPSCETEACAGNAGRSSIDAGGTLGIGGSTVGVGGELVNGGAVNNAGTAGMAGAAGSGGSAGAGPAGSAGMTTAGGLAGYAGTGLAGSSAAAGSNSSGSAGAATTGGASAGGMSTGGTSAAGTSTAGGTAGDSGSAGVAGIGGTTLPVVGIPILKYDFEDGTGTIVSDSSGNGHDGALFATAEWTMNTDGRNGAAAEFTGADPAVAMPSNLFTNAAGLTVSAWVKLTANEAGNRLFDFGSGPDNHIYFTFNNIAGGMELGAQIGGSSVVLATAVMLPLNVWKHVTAVLSAKGAQIYVDGWKVASNAGMVVAPSAMGPTTSNWVGKSQVPDPPFAGTIDEFYVFDNALPLADIRKLAWPKWDYSIWHFDETTGTVAADSSDFKRDATMVRAEFGTGITGNAAQLYNPSDVDQPPLDGDQYVQLPAGVVQNCTSGYTVAAWVNVIAMRAHARVFEFSNDTVAGILGRTMGGFTQQWAFGDFTDGTARYASIDYTWTLGTWHHVAAVRDGQILHAYLDGAESGTKTPFTLPNTVLPVSSLGSTLYNYIGRTRDSAAATERRRLHGFVDEFLLSCRAYSSDEIKMLAVRP